MPDPDHLLRVIQDTLVAYGQRYTPIPDTEALRQIVLSLIPLIGGQALTKSEVYGLLEQVVETFDLDAALTTEINPAVLNVAHTLAKSLSQKPLAAAVGETVVAYVAQGVAPLETVGEHLIERALQAVLHNSINFDLDLDLALVDRQLVMSQVSFQLNLLEQSPRPSKAAQRLAAELVTEIQAIQAQREADLGQVDVTAGTLDHSGLSISSGWTSQRPPAADIAAEDDLES
jgi:hypothetical protein